MKIYLDNCCFNRQFDDQSQLRIKMETEAITGIQEYILKNKLKLVWSYMLDYENYMNPFEERKISIEQWQKLAEIDVEENAVIKHNANKYAGIGLKTKDSIHIVCAVYANCNYFFTTDDKVLNKAAFVKEIAICNPIDFIKEFQK